jgi:hypothetical protein
MIELSAGYEGNPKTVREIYDFMEGIQQARADDDGSPVKVFIWNVIDDEKTLVKLLTKAGFVPVWEYVSNEDEDCKVLVMLYTYPLEDLASIFENDYDEDD